MKKKDRNLLLKDLCARLPYGVIVEDRNGTHVLSIGNTEFTDLFGGKCNIKPYLRPMSSMTEKEEKEYHSLCYNEWCSYKDGWDYHNTILSIDWLNAHYFDYRGLIGRNLAISTEVFNPIKIEI